MLDENANAFERCLAFINCQWNPASPPLETSERVAITMSRETGSGAMPIAQKLADYMQTHRPGGYPWTVFDRNLMEKVLEDHHLPTRLAKFLPEDSVSMINDMVDELLGLHPPSWTIIHQTTETILRLAQLGNVILIGRGANAITARLPNVFHVRLAGALEARLKRIQERHQLSRNQALEFIQTEDFGRARYLKKYYQRDINDVRLYDLQINTDRFTEESVAQLIGEAVLNWIQDKPIRARPPLSTPAHP